MKTQRWYRRYAWVWFALMSGAGLVGGLVIFLDPSAAFDVFAQFGPTLPLAISADDSAVAYVEFVAHWASVATLGFNLMAFCVAAIALRQGQRWAWYASWYWPFMFTVHFVSYETSFRYAQLLWVAISLAALAATSPRMRTNSSTPATPAAHA